MLHPRHSRTVCHKPHFVFKFFLVAQDCLAKAMCACITLARLSGESNVLVSPGQNCLVKADICVLVSPRQSVAFFFLFECHTQGRNLLFLPQEQDFQTQDFLNHPSWNTFILHVEDVQMKRLRVSICQQGMNLIKIKLLNVWTSLAKG